MVAREDISSPVCRHMTRRARSRSRYRAILFYFLERRICCSARAELFQHSPPIAIVQLQAPGCRKQKFVHVAALNEIGGKTKPPRDKKSRARCRRRSRSSRRTAARGRPSALSHRKYRTEKSFPRPSRRRTRLEMELRRRSPSIDELSSGTVRSILLPRERMVRVMLPFRLSPTVAVQVSQSWRKVIE